MPAVCGMYIYVIVYVKGIIRGCLLSAYRDIAGTNTISVRKIRNATVQFTHPVFAALDHPLFAARKEGFAFLLTLFAKQRGSTSVA
jgi:hypothetical protein